MSAASNSRADRRISVSLFVVLLFAVSWIGTAPMVLASWGKIQANSLYLLLQVVCMLFGPGIVAIALSALNGGKAEVKELLRRLIRWRVGWFPWFFVLFVPAGISAGAFWLSTVITHGTPKFRSPADVLVAFISAFVPYLLLNTEELAWRGYLLPRLQSKWGPMRASLVIGILWALFHIPIFLMKGGHPAGHQFVPYFILVVSMSFIFTAIFNRAANSVLVVHVLHQSMNSWPEAFPYYARMTGSHAGEYVFVALVVLVSFTLVTTKTMKQPASDSSSQTQVTTAS